MNINTVTPATYADPPAWLYDLPAVALKGRVPATVGRLADQLFERIERMPSHRPHGHYNKRRHWRKMVYAGCNAVHVGGCVRYSRGAGNGFTKLQRRVLACAVEAGFFHHYPSRPTNRDGAKQSRLLPTAEFRRYVPRDPWEISPPLNAPQIVLMRGRQHKQPSPLDASHPIAVETQHKLAQVNSVNAACEITYQPVHGLYAAQLRPIHYRLFHENWQHGRIYVESPPRRESLRRTERETIQFNGEPSVEWDYGATHPRMAYHLRGLDCPGDPYRLWGNVTTEAQRQLVKLVVNAGLNAANRNDAVAACFQAIRLKTNSERQPWKEGNVRRRSLELRRALIEVGISPKSPEFFKQARAYFDELYVLAIECHAPIAADFGADAGSTFMRVESEIALDVLYHFAAKSVPIIGVHDSFIVPRHHGDELLAAMKGCYHARLGFDPVVK